MSDRFDEMTYVLIFGKQEDDGIQIHHAIGYHEEPSEDEIHADIHDMKQSPDLFPFLKDEEMEARLFPPSDALDELKEWMRGVNPTIVKMSDMENSEDTNTLH